MTTQEIAKIEKEYRERNLPSRYLWINTQKCGWVKIKPDYRDWKFGISYNAYMGKLLDEAELQCG